MPVRLFLAAAVVLTLFVGSADKGLAQQPPNAPETGKLASQGPTLSSTDRMNGALRLHFAHAEGGVVLKYQPHVFQLAGEDRKWYWADAHAFGDVVIVSTSLVQTPVAVRYRWQSNAPAILFNKEGLPVGPFRTDDWPASTNDVGQD